MSQDLILEIGTEEIPASYLPPALEQIKETTGELPDKLSADNGYMSGDNLEALDESPVDVYIATVKGEKKNKILFIKV